MPSLSLSITTPGLKPLFTALLVLSFTPGLLTLFTALSFSSLETGVYFHFVCVLARSLRLWLLLSGCEPELSFLYFLCACLQ